MEPEPPNAYRRATLVDLLDRVLDNWLGLLTDTVSVLISLSAAIATSYVILRSLGVTPPGSFAGGLILLALACW